MKKSFLLIIGLVIFISLNAQQITTNYSNKVKAIPNTYSTTDNGEAPNVLLIEDNFEWGCNDNLEALTNLGANVTMITTTMLANYDLTPFCLVVVTGSIYGGTLSNLNASLTVLEDFVNAGGTLEYHAWTQESIALYLPGGVVSIQEFSGSNTVTLPGHPIVAGIPSPFFGNEASHNYFDNLPAGATIITENNSNLPTTIEYQLGSGLITATCCTYEAYYCYQSGYIGTMMVNNLTYSVNQCGRIPIPIAPWAIAIGIVLIVGITLVRLRANG